MATHHHDIAEVHLRDLFASDPDRAERMSMYACDLHLDYSKNRATAETMTLLVRLADACGLHQGIEATFASAHINVSEDRAALHVALRLPPAASLIVDGVDVAHEVHEVLDRMGTFAEAVRSGTWRGFTGEAICNIINIGIGGSDLGLAMANQALAHYRARHSPPASSPTSTRPSSSKRPMTSIRAKRCSSSARSPSPRSRR